jgi:squalene synthase HpnC
MLPMPQSFTAELERLGPGRTHKRYRLPEARRYCRGLAQTHYENFTVASVLLPRSLLPHFHAVYAYCRWADDLADETGGGPQSLALLRWWREEFLRCYNGEPGHPVMIALGETIRRFAIPPEPFLDLLFAFEQDQLVKRYQTFEQLLAYCRYSANPVGRLVLYICESFTAKRAMLADEICTGLQLANFWQDVSRDLDIGRVYVPEEDRRSCGYADGDLHARRFNESFARLMRLEVERTREFFCRGMPLLDLVSPAVRLDIDLFVRGGLAILRKIERRGYNVWSARPALARWEKGWLVAQALVRRLSKTMWDANVHRPRRRPRKGDLHVC